MEYIFGDIKNHNHLIHKYMINDKKYTKKYNKSILDKKKKKIFGYYR